MTDRPSIRLTRTGRVLINGRFAGTWYELESPPWALAIDGRTDQPYRAGLSLTGGWRTVAADTRAQLRSEIAAADAAARHRAALP